LFEPVRIAVCACKQGLGARSFGSGGKTFVKFAHTLLQDVGAQPIPFLNSFMCRSELRLGVRRRLKSQGSEPLGVGSSLEKVNLRSSRF
jgi:hypothetical protein